MNAIQIGILGSFNNRLPRIFIDTNSLVVKGNDYYRTIAAPQYGTSTDLVDPPKALRAHDQSGYLRDAQLLVQQCQASVPINQMSLPACEAEMYLNSEGDVVRATALYLLHPVNQILNQRLQDLGYPEVRCNMEATQSRTSRTDVSWSLLVGNSRRCMAVLEIKNTYILSLDDLSAAWIGRYDLDTTFEFASESGRGTLLESNAVSLAKQTAKYAIHCRTKFVGVFDWTAMLLFQFHELSNDHIGDTAMATWIDESQSSFRQALLGFLIQAYTETSGWQI